MSLAWYSHLNCRGRSKALFALVSWEIAF
ncbi:DMT family protein [Pontibaca salina]|uniref:DMT family protein n=1 Tax=Pontibaca salina TaxID=2795731 RepID=A0A934HMI5_9RHOB|nr:DMT family protein [Pontibaca salina]